jgi:hypothetical protein
MKKCLFAFIAATTVFLSGCIPLNRQNLGDEELYLVKPCVELHTVIDDEGKYKIEVSWTTQPEVREYMVSRSFTRNGVTESEYIKSV